jgi:ABC-2 type transport system ATP-binding protein
MDYAIQTIGLITRYPTRSRSDGPRGGHGGGAVSSFVNIAAMLKGTRGPFIEALRGVDLGIKKGEVFGLLGPNGAGKSTLIKILCTLVIHDEGEVLVNGLDVRKQPGKVLRNLQAVLPESRGFSWRLSGRQNLEFYSMLYGLTRERARERIDYLLDITGLKDRADDDYQRYSTGMQRKLLLCRALLRDTPCLLFDEPTSGLDPASAVEFRHLLRDKLAREEGKTIFLSTHNLAEAQEICDRIAILDRGKIVTCDTPANVQYALSDEKVFDISFVSPVSADDARKLLGTLEHVAGLRDVRAENDAAGGIARLLLRVDRGLALSSVLDVVARPGAVIAAVNTREPTLEEVFTTVTRRRTSPLGRPDRN